MEAEQRGRVESDAVVTQELVALARSARFCSVVCNDVVGTAETVGYFLKVTIKTKHNFAKFERASPWA